MTTIAARFSMGFGRSCSNYRKFLLGWNAKMYLRRNAIGLVALGVFAIVSVFGQGLHFLPGANHFSSETHGCDHCCHHGTAPTTDSDSTLAHDCLICRFLAQSQLKTDWPIELPLAHNCDLLNDRQPLCTALSIVTLYLARAPPLASQS